MRPLSPQVLCLTPQRVGALPPRSSPVWTFLGLVCSWCECNLGPRIPVSVHSAFTDMNSGSGSGMCRGCENWVLFVP